MLKRFSILLLVTLILGGLLPTEAAAQPAYIPRPPEKKDNKIGPRPNPRPNPRPRPRPIPVPKPIPDSIRNQEPALYGFEGDFVWVDLGLPSGLKWATCNVGAYFQEDYGDYFAWGDTTPKSIYTIENCRTWDKSESWLRDNGYIDDSGNLTMSHDAARQNWGGTWRMPTKEEIEELIANTTITWTTQRGVYGYNVASKNNHISIFLPATGYSSDTHYGDGEYGNYWSSSFRENSYAYDLSFTMDIFHLFGEGRRFGFCIRPVTE